MKKIILDTNFLMIPGILNVDIFDEINTLMDEPYELFIMQGTTEELDNIIDSQKGKFKQAARLAKQLLKMKKIKTIKQKSLYMYPDSKDNVVDDAILAAADGETIVATQDKNFKKLLNEKNIRTIVLRNKKQLELI